MKKLTILLGLLVGTTATGLAAGREVIPFDGDWKFSLGDPPRAGEANFNDRAWRTLDLPHDWSVEGDNREDAPAGGAGGYFPTGTGWYRKTFDLPESPTGDLWSVEFDGVYMNSDVWINGHHLGNYPYGYSGFSYDLTPYLKARGNVIAVRVDNSRQPNSRWYTGSGIYRHVKLVRTGRLHIDKWGVFATTPQVSAERAVVAVSTRLRNEDGRAADGILLRQTLLDPAGRTVGTAESSPADLGPGAEGETTLRQQIAVEAPALWSIETPNLYKLITSLVLGGTEVDRVETNVGIRSIEYHVDRGFLLNGEPVKMKGVNLHHDAGGVGAAVPERMWERRLEILKAGGCNAIRTAHNIPAPEFLDLCDRMGFLVMDEAFDEWAAGKRTYSYHIYFRDWYETDLLAMVRRDRNHPSVVMWSIGNEMPDQSSAEGHRIAQELLDIVMTEDPTRLVTAGNDNIAADGPARARERYLDVFGRQGIVGYNYADRWHERRELLYGIDRHTHPDWRIVGTETGGLGGARGVYAVGNNPDKFEAFYSTRLIDVEQRWKFTLLHDYVIGDFMWTGIDYYGESRWPARGSTSGMIDNCGFPKDGYYFFKSIWTDEPVLHLYPHWNWQGREGQVLPVVCYTNCDTVELFVNGRSFGTKYLEFPRQGTSGGWNTYAAGKVNTSTADLHLSWDVVYEPGELVAVGRKGGKEYVTRIVTTGAPAAIRLTVDRQAIRADPSDVAHVSVEIVDRDGNLVPTADELVRFEVEGARLIGVESGDMRDLSSVKLPERRVFGGMALAIVQADEPGSIRVKATAEGLPPAEIAVTAR